MPMNEQPVIHWFRRDLRLTDNLALHAALSSRARVVPVFVVDPAILDSPLTGAPRAAFMRSGLAALDADLRGLGSGLLVRHGGPRVILPQLVDRLRATAVYVNRDYSPFARDRDLAVAAALSVPLVAVDDTLLRPPGVVLKPDGDPYVVFTPFKRAWLDLPLPARPDHRGPEPGRFHPLTGIEDTGVTGVNHAKFVSPINVPNGGEWLARQRLAAFVDGPIYDYGATRNRLVNDPFSDDPGLGSSYLSPFLRFGMLSPRQVYWAALDARQAVPEQDARDSVDAWVNELIWREFYAHILYHFPHVSRGNFRRDYDAFEWRESADDLAAWRAGQTGYPVVDAAMRQLSQIGWMPNRARMIVASFLTKDLLIHWQAGERYFMQWLIDGDPAANNGGWQWAAGTGTDAQPYFRIFNPVSQSRTFDPAGGYIRRWVPELRGVPDRFIHTPWEWDQATGYPARIVDHGAARARAIAAHKAIKG